MNKFIQTYNSIINSRLFFEDIKTINHNYKKITKIKSKTAKEFYDSLIVINKNEKDNLILESHQDAEFSKALINKIFNSSDFTQIQASEIFNRCSNKIRKNYKIEKDIPLYVFNFSFSTNSKMICNIFSSFNIEFSLKEGSLKEKYEYESKLFKNLFRDAGGLCSDQNSCVLMILNKDFLNENIINHELYHYIQIILKKTKETNKINSKFIDIPDLQLSANDLEYLFDDYEFETHIKVDLINILTELYYKFYSKLSKSNFIDKFIQLVQKDSKNIINNLFVYLSKMKNQDTTSIRLFAACYLVNDKLYLLKAIKWLKDSFK